MIRFSCPRCRTLVTVDDHQAGSKYACVSCGQLMLVPAHARAVRPAGPGGPPPAPPPTSLVDVRVVNGRQAHARSP